MVSHCVGSSAATAKQARAQRTAAPNNHRAYKPSGTFVKNILRCSLAVASTVLLADQAGATPATCATNATTISSNCTSLQISASNVNVVINPGVTVSAPGGTNEIGLWNHSGVTGTTIVNYGTLSSNSEMMFNQGTITSLTNFGTIGGGFHIYNQGNIDTFTNVGNVFGQFRAIYNTGTVTTLNNGQSGSAMYITNSNLPLNYNIIINGSAASGNYGKLSAPNNGGAMNFNIYGNTGTTLVNGVAASTVSAGTYVSVIDGITAANLANAANGKVTGTYAGFNWSLVPESTATIWDLIVATPAPPRTNMGALASTGFTQGAGAAGALDHIAAAAPTGDMGTVVNALGSLGSAQQVSDAVKQTLPILAGGVTEAASNVLSSINRVVQGRVDSARGLSSGDPFIGDGRAWIKPFASAANQHDRDGSSGFKASTGGLAVGVDGALNPQTRVGVALVYAHSKVDGNDPLAAPRVNVDVYSLVGYGNYNVGAYDLFFQADAGRNINRGNRNINFGGLTRVATSDYASTTAHVGLGLSRTLTISERTSFTPALRADYTAIRDNAYSEAGAGALNLNVNGQTTQEFVIGAAGTVSYALNPRSALSANLGAGYDTLARRGMVTAAFAGSPGASFSTQGMSAAPWIVRGGMGYSYRMSDTREINARYDIDAKDRFTNQTVSFKVRQAF
ncbi:MAG: hypothetical protein JWN73_244 [Betaproteobacteria bacterium]|nr:hypothetical protein [Betaproteobacteria bacterium]